MSLVYNPDGQPFYMCKEEDPKEERHEVSVRIEPDPGEVIREGNRIIEIMDNHVRCITRICIVDVIATALIMWYRYPQGVITCLISVVGYQGANKLDRGTLNWYIAFQMLRLVIGILILLTVNREFMYYLVAYMVFDTYIIVRCRILVRLLQ